MGTLCSRTRQFQFGQNTKEAVKYQSGEISKKSIPQGLEGQGWECTGKPLRAPLQSEQTEEAEDRKAPGHQALDDGPESSREKNGKCTVCQAVRKPSPDGAKHKAAKD